MTNKHNCYQLSLTINKKLMFKFYSSIKIQKTKDQVCIIYKNGITHIRILNKDMDITIGTVQSYHKEENALVVYGYTDSEAKICIKTQHLHCRFVIRQNREEFQENENRIQFPFCHWELSPLLTSSSVKEGSGGVLCTFKNRIDEFYKASVLWFF